MELSLVPKSSNTHRTNIKPGVKYFFLIGCPHLALLNTEELIQLFPVPPRRVVSLVPSLTETLFDFGIGESVVGVTDYCIHPAGAIEHLPHLGGTRHPRVADIIALDPSLVLANQEENSKEVLNDIRDANITIWMTFPKTVWDSLEIMRVIVQVFQIPNALIALATLEKAVELAEADISTRTPTRYFCPIWWNRSDEHRPWWMTFNEETYANDVLRLLGGQNIFATRQRNYPLAADLGEIEGEDRGDRDTRYPRITEQEVLQANPDVILLPDEPFDFKGEDYTAVLEVFQDTHAVRNGRTLMLDGSLIFWHGTRLGRALQQLGGLFS
jgi:ABC-type Fe3+-hydroxamate transport system substrate-binding protein